MGKRGISNYETESYGCKTCCKTIDRLSGHTRISGKGRAVPDEKEDMTVEAETKVADETFKSSVEALKDVISEVEFKEALDVRYNESFVVEKKCSTRSVKM